MRGLRSYSTAALAIVALASCGDPVPQFQKCSTDRYATHLALGECSSEQCMPRGEYLFLLELMTSTCNKPTQKISFTDQIITSGHPLRFLLLCGYNRVIIDETWGGPPTNLPRYQAFEGSMSEDSIVGNYEKVDQCESYYRMEANLLTTWEE